MWGRSLGMFTLRPHSSSLLGLPYRILNMNHKRELLWGLRVGCSVRVTGIRAESLAGL